MNWWNKLYKKEKQPTYTRCHECNSISAKGSELIFISQIGRTGIEIHMINDKDMSHLDNATFLLYRLSVTHNTYIACEFNSYVVKFKTKQIT